jgi:hypothetical protein
MTASDVLPSYSRIHTCHRLSSGNFLDCDICGCSCTSWLVAGNSCNDQHIYGPRHYEAYYGDHFRLHRRGSVDGPSTSNLCPPPVYCPDSCFDRSVDCSHWFATSTGPAGVMVRNRIRGCAGWSQQRDYLVRGRVEQR